MRDAAELRQLLQEYFEASGSPTAANLNLKLAEQAARTVALFCKKNNDYGPNNISALGIPGLIVRLHDKVCRLKTLLLDRKGGPSVNDESVEDTVLDLCDYGWILLLLLQGKWPAHEENFESWPEYSEYRKKFPKEV